MAEVDDRDSRTRGVVGVLTSCLQIASGRWLTWGTLMLFTVTSQHAVTLPQVRQTADPYRQQVHRHYRRTEGTGVHAAPRGTTSFSVAFLETPFQMSASASFAPQLQRKQEMNVVFLAAHMLPSKNQGSLGRKELTNGSWADGQQRRHALGLPC